MNLDKLIKKIIKEEGERSSRYMFFSNLQQMKDQCDILLSMNHDLIEQILEDGHDWAQDHIAEAKNNMDQVYDFLLNESKTEGVSLAVTQSPSFSNTEDLIESEEITEKKKKNVPTNPSLWKQCLAWAKQRYEVCPSAYCNGAAAKRYKEKGGKWKKG